MKPWQERWDWRSWADAMGGRPEDVAHAHLAAAAPELYRALEAILSADVLGTEAPLYQAGVSALRKARGEQ